MANTNTAAANTTWKGDAAVYTGKTQLLHGGLFYELLLLEGHLKGQIKLTLHPPKTAKDEQDDKRLAEIIFGKAPKVKLVCQECGKTYRVSPNAVDPRCKCGSVDYEVA